MASHFAHILFLSKDPQLAANLQKILNRSLPGTRVVRASSAEEFHRELGRTAFQACLVDSSVLKSNGHNLLDEVYKLTPQLPFIFLLEKEMRSLGEEVLERGAFDYLVKVDGVLAALPFVIDQALGKKPADFKLEGTGPQVPDYGTGLFEINESGRFISFDEGLKRIFGIEEKELYKSYLTDFLPEADREKFYFWRATVLDKSEGFHLRTQIVLPEKGVVPVEIHLFPYERNKHFSGYRGFLKLAESVETAISEIREAEEEEPEVRDFFYEIYGLNDYLAKGLTQLFLMRVAEIPRNFFKFKKVHLFLRDGLKRRFQKEISLQPEDSSPKEGLLSEYFSLKEMEFLNKTPQFVHFVHQSLFSEEQREKLYTEKSKGLFQPLDWISQRPWKLGDRLFLAIRSAFGQLLGFLILEEPEKGKIPPRWFLRHLEIYAIFVSTLFDHNTRFRDMNNRHKRLKQLFTVLNAFYLDMPLGDLLKEVAWSVKFSMGFNLVILGVLSRSTHRLELKAVAVDNREKARILSRLRFTPTEISDYLLKRYRVSQSYFITQRDNPFYLIKRIYGLPINRSVDPAQWYYSDVLIVPLRSRKGKMMGAFILDDPEDHRRPDLEAVQILEKIAQRVSVTIENKITYTRLLRQVKQLQAKILKQTESEQQASQIKKFFKKLSF